MTMRLQETEGFAGQAVRAAAKGSMVARRDPLPIRRFTIEDERGAAERSRLERAQTDAKTEAKTEASLVERRAAQRDLDRRAAAASTSERRAEPPEPLPEGRDLARSTEQDAVSGRPAKADAAEMSPARRDPLEKDEEKKVGGAPSEERPRQDASLSSMISPPLPLGRVLAEAASSPAGRDVADIASEAEEYGPSTKADEDDGRGREAEGQATQGQDVHGRDVATATVAVSLIPSGTPPLATTAAQTQPGSADGPAPETVQRTGIDGKDGRGTAPAVDSVGPGSASIQAASIEATSATSIATETRDDGNTFADVLAGVSLEAAKDAMPSNVPTASTGTIAANSIFEPIPSLPTPHQGAPVPLGAVPMTIGLRSLSGSSHFEIRLDPVDLGRIDVRLEIDRDHGTVTTSVVVDRADTLAMLQRDSGNLQQALAQAGLDPGAGISLSLRGDGMSGDHGTGDPRSEGRETDGRGGSSKADPSIPQPLTDYVAPRMLRGIAGIDIRI